MAYIYDTENIFAKILRGEILTILSWKLSIALRFMI